MSPRDDWMSTPFLGSTVAMVASAEPVPGSELEAPCLPLAMVATQTSCVNKSGLPHTLAAGLSSICNQPSSGLLF